MKTIKIFKITAWFIVGLFLSILSSFISLFVPLQIKQTIDFKYLNNQILGLRMMSGIVVLLLLSTVISAISDYIISREGDKQIANIRLKVQTHLLKLPLSFFNENLSGQLASRVINDSSVVKNFITQVIPTLITNVITIIGTMFFLFVLDWKITCLIIIIFPILSFLAIPIGKISKKISAKYQLNLSILNGITTEAFQEIRSVKLSVAENEILKKFKKAVIDIYNISLRADMLNAIIGPVQILISYSVIIAVIVYGAIRVSEQSLTIGTLVSIVVYFFQLMPAVDSLTNFYSSYKQAIGSTMQINKIINLPVEESFNNKDQAVKNVSHGIELKNVVFSYKNHLVLNKINMEFPSRSKIAIVGPSGAGKTTIINILTRLYPLKEGELLLDNKNAKDFDLYEWRKMFSVVTQENSIISGTIKDNLLFGVVSLVSQEEIRGALKAANLWDFVYNLPQKEQTVVGEKGVKLSGGQRQRLQIARSYLKKSSFIIFDEATSNLDADSEKLIAKSMAKLSKERTVIAVAHRLSTITDSDCIYFLKDSEIKASGTHLELYSNLSEYRKFVKEQMLVEK
ncbi:ABC transporter ATP-binding protein [Pediococcus acidilactici]|uniref:ABC transporter ATP-binding protein n=1 Tax=Pediococcus acidilactici TaxID=1254 RepID=UPI001951E083|nr:ABC transporter ATP-binding protein [Pediococcus acidilactici]MBM6586264.1 ABC transporter ATP-binding protein [Pediococcus acidilactici]